jgi:hypothetical protein
MTTNSLDDLTRRLSNLTAEIDKQLRHRVTIESHDGEDDGDGYDDGDYEDVSNPSLEADDDSDEPDGDSSYNELPDDDEDHVGKRSINEYLREHDTSNRPGALKTSDHATYRTKTQAMVDNIASTENCSKTEAMRRLRERHPDVVNGNPVSKRASEPVTAEQLIAEQVARGFSPAMAKVRVAQMYGFRAFDHRDMSKRELASSLTENDLLEKAQQHWEHGELSRCESLRKARLERPGLYRRMQR